MWDLPQPGIAPMSLALADRLLTTGAPGKSVAFKGGGSGTARGGPGLGVGTRKRAGRASWRRIPRWWVWKMRGFMSALSEKGYPSPFHLGLPRVHIFPDKCLAHAPTRDQVPLAPPQAPLERLPTLHANPGVLTAPQQLVSSTRSFEGQVPSAQWGVHEAVGMAPPPASQCS